jgi:NAD+ synthetase
MDYKIVLENLRNHFKDYMTTSRLKSVVLGVSGGIDSALVAAIVKPVCDELNTPLIGRSISIGSNTLDEQERARNIGAQFISEFKEVDLCVMHEFMKTEFENKDGIDDGTHGSNLRQGNLKARVRMCYLYNYAHRMEGMVLGTTNKTEWELGYFTIFGDGGVDYEGIIELWKTDVYGLSHYIADNELTSDAAKEALRACIDAVATAGLGITDSDLEEIGKESFDEVDDILKRYIGLSVSGEEKSEIEELKKDVVVQRHLSSSFKREIPICIPRSEVLRGC